MITRLRINQMEQLCLSLLYLTKTWTPCVMAMYDLYFEGSRVVVFYTFNDE
jgi:hypothetical protein